jgi:Mrp family chromosome partitioning ATPase
MAPGDEPEQGLAELISGATDCRALATATMYPGIYLLTAQWDAEAQGSLDYERLLEACTDGFPVVIVVAPPLDDPTAIPLAAACDGTYLVVRLGYVSDGTARYLTANLRAAGARMVGAVALMGE